MQKIDDLGKFRQILWSCQIGKSDPVKICVPEIVTAGRSFVPLGLRCRSLSIHCVNEDLETLVIGGGYNMLE